MFPNSQSEKGGCLIIVYKVKHILWKRWMFLLFHG